MLRRREVWILVPIQLVGIVVFLFGFFPQKVPLQGSGSFEEMPSPGNCTISPSELNYLILNGTQFQIIVTMD